jgi:hypothetical protein
LLSQEVAKKSGGSGKKGKKGKAGKGTASEELGVSSSTVKIKPCPSFFRFFLPDSNSQQGKHASRLHDPTAVPQDDDDNDFEDFEDDEGVRSSLSADMLDASFGLKRIICWQPPHA